MTEGRIWEQALAGSRWLVEHQNADGSWIGLSDPHVDAFYKGSWALSVTGEPSAAHRVLNYVGQHFLQDDGDFAPRHHPWHTRVHHLYANSYFIIGSMVTGRYDIAVPAVPFLLSQQDEEHGGFYTRRTEPDGRELTDTMSTSASGVACLAAGRIDAARRAADYLTHIVDLQPEAEERFFTTIEADGRLGTEVADEDEAWWRIIDTHTENQCWYAVGLPFAFLIRLSEATGEAKHRDLAQWYFDFQQRCVDPWDGGSSGKAGWACAMLYRITREAHYGDIARHVAGYIMDRQNDDGSWVSSPEGYGEEESEAEFSNGDFDVTAEYTLWLALIAANISAHDAE